MSLSSLGVGVTLDLDSRVVSLADRISFVLVCMIIHVNSHALIPLAPKGGVDHVRHIKPVTPHVRSMSVPHRRKSGITSMAYLMFFGPQTRS